MLHVLIGENPAYKELHRLSASGKTVNWVVPKPAKPGEDVVFFFRGVSAGSFVGHAVVATTPRAAQWTPGKVAYRADLRDICTLAHPVALDTIRTALPQWKWTTYPRAYTTVSGRLERSVRRLLVAEKGEVPAQDVTVLEEIAKEAGSATRGRSALLRKQAIHLSHGVCAACETDFSTTPDETGWAVLHVHHKKPDARPFARLEDVAVVCANCHALIHADPKRLMKVEVLRKKWAASRSRTDA